MSRSPAWLLAASDFHAGRGDARDAFALLLPRLEDELLDLADLVAEDQPCVALLGDVVDLWACGEGALSAQSTRKALALIAGALGTPQRPVLWVRGNHDGAVPDSAAAGLPLQLCDRVTVPWCPRDYAETFAYLCHGHEFDPWNSWLGVGKAATAAASAVGAVFPAAERALKRAGSRGRGVGRYDTEEGLRGRIRQHAAGWLGLRVVVAGHSHRADSQRWGGVSYENTGTWAEHGWLIGYTDGTFRRFARKPFSETNP